MLLQILSVVAMATGIIAESSPARVLVLEGAHQPQNVEATRSGRLVDSGVYYVLQQDGKLQEVKYSTAPLGVQNEGDSSSRYTESGVQSYDKTEDDLSQQKNSERLSAVQALGGQIQPLSSLSGQQNGKYNEKQISLSQQYSKVNQQPSQPFHYLEVQKPQPDQFGQQKDQSQQRTQFSEKSSEFKQQFSQFNEAPQSFHYIEIQKPQSEQIGQKKDQYKQQNQFSEQSSDFNQQSSQFNQAPQPFHYIEIQKPQSEQFGQKKDQYKQQNQFSEQSSDFNQQSSQFKQAPQPFHYIEIQKPQPAQSGQQRDQSEQQTQFSEQSSDFNQQSSQFNQAPQPFHYVEIQKPQPAQFEQSADQKAPENFAANIQYRDVQPLSAPIYAFNPNPLIRILKK